MGKFDILNYGSISCDMCVRSHTLTELLLTSFQLRLLIKCKQERAEEFPMTISFIFSRELMGRPSLSCRIKNRSSVIQNYAIRGIHRNDDPMNNHNRGYSHRLLRQQSSSFKHQAIIHGERCVICSTHVHA